MEASNVINNKIICKSPNVLNTNGIVDEKVIEMINAGDIHGAMNMVNGLKTRDSKNIIESVTTSLVNERHNLNALLDYKKTKIYNSEDEKNEAISKIQEKLNSVNTRIKSIEDKISNYKDNTCPICFGDYENPVILGCECNTLFCLSCITAEFQHGVDKKSCPMCRGNIKGITLISDSEIKENVIEEKVKSKIKL